MTPPAPGSSRRREAAAVAALTLLGAVLRSWQSGRLGLVHFDEGVYAMTGLWSGSSRGLAAMNSVVIPFAPGGYPTLVGLAYLLLGVGDTAAIFVSQAAGVATIPVAAAIARRAFGPGAGTAAAAFAAIAGPHVAFSRMALTDATFLLAFLAAIGLGCAFLDRPGPVRGLALGLAVGLAQNLKYNGVLAGAAVAVAAALQVIRGRRLREAARLFGFGAVAAATAAAAYWPWFRFVERNGGYGPLLAHHRGYLGGLDAWPRHWRLQLAEQAALGGVAFGPFQWGLAAWCLAWIGVVATVGARPARGAWSWWAALGLGALAFGLSAGVGWWLPLAAVPGALRDARPGPRLIAVAWTTFAVLTPFYHPYARLWLPLHGLGWLLLGGLTAELGTCWASGTTRAPIGVAKRPAILGLVAMVAIACDWLPPGRPRPIAGLLAPSDSVRAACLEITDRLDAMPPAARPAALRVLGRPSVHYYLLLTLPRGVDLQRVDDLAALSRPGGSRTLVLDDLGLEPRPTNPAGAPGLAAAWERLAEEPTWLNPPTLLDHDPAAAYRAGVRAESSATYRPLVLYRQRTRHGPPP